MPMRDSPRLSKDEERAVAAFLENEADTPRSNPRELLAAFCAHADADTAAVDAWRRRFPGWSAEQIRSAMLFDNPYFGGMEALRRGIVLRIERDDPSELAAFLSLAARHLWAVTGHARSNPACERERHFLPILEAVAANDTFVVAKYAQSLMDAPPTKQSVREYVPLLSGVVALALNDERELQAAVSGMECCKPKAYVAGMYEAVRGAAARSGKQVAEGLTKMLKAWPKFVFDDPILRLVCPHAHGLYRLCQRFSSELVAEFDVSRGGPWDAGFHVWWETAPQPWLNADFGAIDVEAHRVLVGLQPPTWWCGDEAAAW